MSDDSGQHLSIDTVGGILHHGGAVLLGLRSPRRRSCPLCWDVIGGHVEPGESPDRALARELEEEIGVTAPTSIWLRDIGYRSHGTPMMLRLFLVDNWAGSPMVANDEHVELRWFEVVDAARLPNIALEAYRDVLAGLPYR